MYLNIWWNVNTGNWRNCLAPLASTQTITYSIVNHDSLLNYMKKWKKQKHIMGFINYIMELHIQFTEHHFTLCSFIWIMVLHHHL